MRKKIFKPSLNPGAQMRHGDVLLQVVGRIPEAAVPIKGRTLAEGEATGHAHVLDGLTDNAYQLFEGLGRLYVQTGKHGAILTHEEHGPIQLPSNTCFVCGIGPDGALGRTQREYDPQGDRPVFD